MAETQSTPQPEAESPATIPLKLLLQVRDGVPNLISEFEAPLSEDAPAEGEDLPADDPARAVGAKKFYTVDSSAIVQGLAEALVEEGHRLLTSAASQGVDPEAVEALRSWLLDLGAWVLTSIDTDTDAD